jgi:para-nitrobenzyl esterase
MSLQAMAASVSNVIKLSDGTVEGNPRDPSGVLSFKGIPFAAPPTGNLRWKPPHPPQPWTDVLNATMFGNACYGAPGLNAKFSVIESEDCLTINVWTPANSTQQELPVMVWIHGGGFQYGTSANPEWEGSILATKDVIVVSFNYRVSTLGFLALPELDAEGSPSGNYGLQDMILALKWVESNIGAFGGNAKNVTIWGESAGAHAVGLLLSSQQSRGLYSGAILESGAFWDYEYGSIQTFSEARAQGAELQNALGANSTAQLRQESVETLVSTIPYSPSSSKPTLFGPSIDCYVLSLPPAEIFSKGLQPNVPMLAGINAREDVIFAAESFPYDTPQHFRDAAALWFGQQSLSSFSSAYPSVTQAQTNVSAATLLGDMTIREQTWEAAAYQSAVNSNVYFYWYTYSSPYSPVPIHTAEIPFVFGTLTPSPLAPDTPPSPSDEAFSEQLQTYWTNFAKYGTPNHAGDGLAQWPTYAGGAGNVQPLTSPIAPTMYNITGFEFLKGFRTAGLFPLQWHSLNVSSVTN